MTELIKGSLRETSLRQLVKSAYQLQQLRIQTGLRIVAYFKNLLGQEPGKRETELSPEAIKLLAELRASYNRITDALTKKPFRKGAVFVGDGKITDYAAYTLVDTYVILLAREEHMFDQFDKMINNHVMYSWFQEVRGVGPAMAAVLLSEVDLEETTTVGKMWALCGLDVLSVQREMLKSDLPKYGIFTLDDLRVVGPGKKKDHYIVNISEGRNRTKEHLVRREYTTKGGEQAMKDSVSFNPFLKTKVRGVLSGFLMMGDGYFRVEFDNYRHRLENMPQHAGKTPAHILEMAKRYMVKLFLQYFILEWRKRAGLEITEAYHVRKLGMVHHGPGFTGDTKRSKEDVQQRKLARQGDAADRLERNNARKKNVETLKEAI